MEPGLLNDAKMREDKKIKLREKNIEIPCPSFYVTSMTK